MDELRERHTKELVELQAELKHTNKQLTIHQQQLEEFEHSYQNILREAVGVQQDLARAQEEVRAKTSQVKQYKKQVDQLKAMVSVSNRCMCMGPMYITHM